MARSISAFLPKLPNQEQKDPPDWIIWDIWALLSSISIDILLAKAFLTLVVCLVVTNNSCGNSSSWKFFLFTLNTVSALFFAVYFNLFNSVNVSLTSVVDNLPLFLILLDVLEKMLVLFLYFFLKSLK